MTDPNWLDTAACRDVDSAVFFPLLNVGRGHSKSRASDPVWDAARAVCARCPATGADGPCVAEGFRFKDEDSMRGGLTPDQRARMRPSRRTRRRTCVECGAEFIALGGKYTRCDACSTRRRQTA